MLSALLALLARTFPRNLAADSVVTTTRTRGASHTHVALPCIPRGAPRSARRWTAAPGNEEPRRWHRRRLGRAKGAYRLDPRRPQGEPRVAARRTDQPRVRGAPRRLPRPTGVLGDDAADVALDGSSAWRASGSPMAAVSAANARGGSPPSRGHGRCALAGRRPLERGAESPADAVQSRAHGAVGEPEAAGDLREVEVQLVTCQDQLAVLS
jgi:hypothetical protein